MPSSSRSEADPLTRDVTPEAHAHDGLMAADGDDVARVYGHRFSTEDEAARTLVWRELTRWLQRYVPASEAVVQQLRVAANLVKPGGRVLVLQPNIRLVGGAYWDFIDHKVPLTEHSLVEAAELAGLRTRRLIVRFLPYTSKGRLPANPLLVRAYLALRPAWLLLGKQTFYVGERARS